MLVSVVAEATFVPVVVSVALLAFVDGTCIKLEVVLAVMVMGFIMAAIVVVLMSVVVVVPALDPVVVVVVPDMVAVTVVKLV